MRHIKETGVLITLMALAAAGCGSPAVGSLAAPTTNTQSDVSSVGAAVVDQTLSFRVVGGAVIAGPSATTVTAGSTVTVTVTSDRADELHIHGYDREVPVAAGGAASVTFTADITGVFDVELHESAKTLCQLTVQP